MNTAPFGMRGILLSIVVAGLSACSWPLSYQAREAPGPAQVQAFEQRSLNQEDLKVFLQSQGRTLPALDEAWDLETLAIASGFFSADFRAAEAHWRSTVSEAAGATVTPGMKQLDVLLDHHSTTDQSRSSPWTLGLGFEVVLTDADRKKAKAALAHEESALARVRMASVLWTEHEAVIQATIEFDQAKRERTFYQARETLMKERAERLQSRMNRGLESPAVYRNAELLFTKATQERQDAEKRVAEKARELKKILHLPGTGHVPKIKDDVEQRFARLLTLSNPELQAESLLNRLDVAEAEVQFRWSDARLRLAIAEQYPEISLSPGYEWDQNDHRFRLGLSLPINLPKLSAAHIHALEASREEAAMKLMGVQERVIQEIYQRAQAVKEARERLNAMTPLMTRVEREEERVRRAVSSGDEDELALTDARIHVNALQLQKEGLRGEVMRSLWALEVALAKPSSESRVNGTQP